MGALRWNSSAIITKCSLTMWRGETVYDVIVDVNINDASRAAIGLGPYALPDKSGTYRSRC
jgi:hypothetical protein